MSCGVDEDKHKHESARSELAASDNDGLSATVMRVDPNR